MNSSAIMMSSSFHVKPEYVDEVTKGLASTKFDPQVNEDGIFDIGFYGDLCTEETFAALCTVAPNVDDGSYIEMLGDSLWRWVFKDGECKEIYPDIRWEAPISDGKRVIIVVENGTVTGVITNDTSIDLIEILDKDYLKVTSGEERKDLLELEREVTDGLACGILVAIY